MVYLYQVFALLCDTAGEADALTCGRGEVAGVSRRRLRSRLWQQRQDRTGILAADSRTGQTTQCRSVIYTSLAVAAGWLQAAASLAG